MSSSVLFGCSGCGSQLNLLVLEAESAIVDGTKANDAQTFIASSDSDSNYVTSNSKYITNLNVVDNLVYFVVTAETAGEADVNLRVANATEDASSFSVSDAFSMTLNGTAVTVPATEVGTGSEYTDAWVDVVIEDLSLVAGSNVFTLKMTSASNAINIDYFAVDLDSKSDVSAHTYSWETETISATCTEEGYIYRECSVSGVRYLYSTIAATGHSYGDWRIGYDDDGNVVRYHVCSVCGHIEYDDEWSTDDKYVSQVFDTIEEIEAREAIVNATKVTYEAEYAFIDISGGLSNSTSPIEVAPESADASNGEIAANISKIGNSITFKLSASEAAEGSVVIKAANVLYTDSGIGDLDPLSDYIGFEINGETVNGELVSFAGNTEWNWYLWRYILIEGIDFVEGENTIVMYPKEASDGTVTIPNTDVMYIYTDKDVITPIYDYTYTATKNDDYSSEYEYNVALEGSDGEYSVTSNAAAEGDLVLTLTATEEVTNVNKYVIVEFADSLVSLSGITLSKGDNTIVISGVSVPLGTVSVVVTASGVSVKSAELYASVDITIVAGTASIDADYDFMNDGTKVPNYVYDVSIADRGGNGSVNSNSDSYNGTVLENFSGTGNTLTWTVVVNKEAKTDIALRMACANYSSETWSNSNMIGLDNYLSFSINGVAVDLSEIDLTYDSSVSEWFDYKMIVASNVVLNEGYNTISIVSLSGAFPNTDCMAVFSETDGVKFDIVYDVETTSINNSFVSEYENSMAYSAEDDSTTYTAVAGVATMQDIIITFNASEAIADLSDEMSLVINGQTVKVGYAVGAGEVKLIIQGIDAVVDVNTVALTISDKIAITSVEGYTSVDTSSLLAVAINADYDAFKNGGTMTPIFTYEAEDCTKTGSWGDESDSLLSGGAGVGGGSNAGNVLTFSMEANMDGTVDVVLRAACAWWTGSNTDMIGLGDHIYMTINGQLVDLYSVDLTFDSSVSEWHDYKAIVISGVEFTEGTNVVEIAFKSGGFPNTDCLYIYSAVEDMTITKTITE